MIPARLLATAAVFHGTPFPPEQSPWLVSLTTRGPYCGGALIAPDRVLTAAHCVQGADPGRVSVRLAGRRVAADATGKQRQTLARRLGAARARAGDRGGRAPGHRRGVGLEAGVDR